jgi:hypothetical protein
MRVRLRCLCVHARTSTYGGRRANPATACPACGAANETLSHFVLECPATSAPRDAMIAEWRSIPRCAEKLRSLLSLTDASDMVLRFVSDDIWGGAKVCRVAARSIADYLVHAWNHSNACQHSGAVLPPPSAPAGRGADGDVAMA